MSDLFISEDFPAVQAAMVSSHECKKQALQQLLTEDYFVQALCNSLRVEDFFAQQVQEVFSALRDCDLNHLSEFFLISKEENGKPNSNLHKASDESFLSQYKPLHEQQEAEIYGMVTESCINVGMNVEL